MLHSLDCHRPFYTARVSGGIPEGVRRTVFSAKVATPYGVVDVWFWCDGHVTPRMVEGVAEHPWISTSVWSSTGAKDSEMSYVGVDEFTYYTLSEGEWVEEGFDLRDSVGAIAWSK